MTTKDRLLEFLKYRKIGQTRFEESCGLSRGFICNIKGTLTPKTLDKIKSVYPELDTVWLISGRGSMLSENSAVQPEESNEQPDIEAELIRLRKENKELLDIIRGLNERIICLNDSVSRLNMQIHDMMFSGESRQNSAG